MQGRIITVVSAVLVFCLPAEANTSLRGVAAPLAAKVREIQAVCGSTILSTINRRPNRSNHPAGRAVDLKGNPRCMYNLLRQWPGGYSTDYARAGHLHISYSPGGQEWGARFVHSKTSRVQYAKALPEREEKAP